MTTIEKPRTEVRIERLKIALKAHMNSYCETGEVWDWHEVCRLKATLDNVRRNQS